MSIWLSGILALNLLAGLAPPGVLFSGNQAFSDDELVEYLAERGLRIPGLLHFHPEDSERALELLTQCYRDRGFPLARVQLEKGGGKHRFAIIEGPRTRLRRVQVLGNSAFPAERLEGFFRPNRWFSAAQAEEAVHGIVRLYRDHGYLQVEISRPMVGVKEVEVADHLPVPFQTRWENAAVVSVSISEGRRFHYGNVNLPPELQGLELPELRAGELYRESELEEFKRRAIGRLASEGRLAKELQVQLLLRPRTGRVDVNVRLSVYPTLMVRRIEFTGAHRYPDSFYRREMKLSESDFFHPEKLQASLLNLAATGALSSVTPEDVELEVDEEHQEVDIRIRLDEADPRAVFYSLGSGPFGNLEGTLFYSVANLLGLGEKLGLELTTGDQTGSVAVTLASRYLLGTDLPVSMTLRFFRRHLGFSLPGIDDEARRFLGIREKGFQGMLAYRVRDGEQVGTGLAVQEVVAGDLGRRNLVLEPFWAHQSGPETSPRFFRAAQRFSLFDGESRAWNTRSELVWRRIREDPSSKGRFQLDLQGAHAVFFGASQPLSERLFFGPQDVRGFSAVTSGPWGEAAGRPIPLGGDTLFLFKSEYERPLNSYVAVAPFFDAGWNATLRPLAGHPVFEPTNGVLRSALGSELRVRVSERLPATRFIVSLNPLRLDETILTGSGPARLRDPLISFRVAFSPQ